MTDVPKNGDNVVNQHRSLLLSSPFGQNSLKPVCFPYGPTRNRCVGQKQRPIYCNIYEYSKFFGQKMIIMHVKRRFQRSETENTILLSFLLDPETGPQLLRMLFLLLLHGVVVAIRFSNSIS